MAGTRTQTAPVGTASRVSLPRVDCDDYQGGKRCDTNTFLTGLFPEAAEKHGPAFLQTCVTDADGLPRWLPLEINVDFFASALAGDHRLGHEVVYYSPEGQFYFMDPCMGAFCPTTEAKLEALLSYYLVRCAQEAGPFVEIGPIFTSFREHEKLRKVITRAKALLAADQSFFDAASGRKRMVGDRIVEPTDRPFHVMFVEETLSKHVGNPLTVSDAFSQYLAFCQSKSLPVLSRVEFKEATAEIIRQKFGIGLRRDVRDGNGRHQEGWIGIMLQTDELTQR